MAEGSQAGFEQGLGVSRVVNATASVIFGDVDVIPQGIRLRFGVSPGNDSTSRIEQAGGRQLGFEVSKLASDLGLDAVVVEVLEVGMTARAGLNSRGEGVVAAFPMWQVTQVFSTVVACMLGLPVTAPAPPMPSNMSLCGPLALWHLIRNGHVNENRGCCFTAPIVMHVFYGVYLLERFQGCFEQGLGIGWVVDAHALIIGYEFVVPHCICDRFGNLQGS